MLGCLIWRMPCYNKGKCRVFLGYVFSHVWKFGQIHGRPVMSSTKETVRFLPLQVLETLEETGTLGDRAGVRLVRVRAKLYDRG